MKMFLPVTAALLDRASPPRVIGRRALGVD
jgi:hypothetical protein